MYIQVYSTVFWAQKNVKQKKLYTFQWVIPSCSPAKVLIALIHEH